MTIGGILTFVGLAASGVGTDMAGIVLVLFGAISTGVVNTFIQRNGSQKWDLGVDRNSLTHDTCASAIGEDGP